MNNLLINLKQRVQTLLNKITALATLYLSLLVTRLRYFVFLVEQLMQLWECQKSFFAGPP
jgi:hypothetical protein